ncbi:ketopantoate reductase family protein [Sporomusa termitida]|uniref:2-dehydropantoate 2-reductase n=1 Tax=Sporomusa termitida TaxID=2377 RepID=A0A517DYT4_9FIRM|nr:ketopantoate reductase family protein [Sporomusa termitida]QDR82537.1 Putative 2-dehydropantoate 2-reductase [Sporomusa termitida]
MRFAIIGAGVMGCLAGAMLKNAGADVWLVDSNPALVRHIQHKGLQISSHDREEHIEINIVQSPGEIQEPMDVILFLVKSCCTEAAAQSAQCIAGENTYIMTLQNGIGNVEILANYYGREKILYGIMEFAGKAVDAGHIRAFISNHSKICFGSAQKIINDDMKKIAGLFGASGIKVIVEEDIDSEVWIKLRNNSTNAVFGLLRLSMGQALAAEGMAEVMQAVRDEVIAVAKAKGICFTDEQLSVNKGKTPINPELYAHLPSTALDMKNKTQTEVEFINGAVYREGLRLGVSTPNNELLYKLIKIMEQTYAEQF